MCMCRAVSKYFRYLTLEILLLLQSFNNILNYFNLSAYLFYFENVTDLFF